MSELIRGWFDRDQAPQQSYMQRKSLCNYVSLSGPPEGDDNTITRIFPGMPEASTILAARIKPQQE